MLPTKSRFLALVAGTSAIALSMAMPVCAQNATEAKEAEAAKADGDAVIVVTARRKALQSAIEIKRKADTIVDSIVADEAGKLPDNSITEVLQRISGVSISRYTSTNGGSSAFQIEGTGVTVRGLPFNSSMLNGQQLFSANGASAISWNEVTPELMAGVDVYKASRADLIEGGASLINLRTHLPFDFKAPQLNLTVGGSYGSQVKKGSPRVSAMVSRRFDTNIGEIGVLWDVAYSRLHQQSSNLQVGAMFGEYSPNSTRDDHMVFVPSSFTWSNNLSQRDRYGAYQAIQWRPTENLTLTNTVFFSQYIDDGWSNSGSVGSSPSATSAVMPKVGSPVEFNADGAFRRGSLTVGSTGNAVEFQNQSKTIGWLPSWYQLDCGATFGGPASSLQWDWSASAGVDPSNPPAGWDGRRLVQCGPAGTFNPSGGASASHSKSSTLDISQSFLWTAGEQITVRGGAQYVRSRMTGENMFVGLAQTSPLVNSMDVDLTGSLPLLTGLSTTGLLDKSKAYLSNFGYHKPDNKGEMTTAHFDVEYRSSDEGFLRTVTFGARIAKRTENDDNVGTYWAPLSQSWLSNPWGAHPGDPSYGAGNILYLTNPNVRASDYEVATFPNFFGGDAAVPAQLLVPSQSLMQSYDWYHLLKSYNGQIANGTADQYWTRYIDQGLNKTDSRIVNKAIYIQAKFAHDGFGFIPAFSGNIGVRSFTETLTASGLLSTPNATNLALTEKDSTDYFNAQQVKTANPNANPVFPTLYAFVQGYSLQQRNYSYHRVLPSFNIKFDVSDTFIIRAAASRASAPPNLNDIRAGGSVGARSRPATNPQAPAILTGVSVNGGGADLKPTMINSQDVTFEFYPSSSSFFYVDLFAKQIEDHPVFHSFIANNLPIPAKAYANGQTPPVNAGDPDPGTPTTLDLPWLYLQNKTSEQKAEIKGFEIGGRKFFDQLPGWMRGFGIDANLTYIDSKNPAQQANSVLTPPPANGALPGLNPDGTVPQTYPDLPYAGLSKWAYNIQLLYSRDKVNVRLAYNWRDKALLSTNVNPLSYATSGGNPYILNTSPTNFDSTHSYPVYNMVPAYMAAAGYLDLGFDYRLNEKISVSFNANNLLNTKSKTLQEPVPGVFEPYDYNVSDQRYEVTVRARF
ncbi:TonB-dependent receptor [Asticcacaulis excentricus]|uniref:TonB-dependent receptor n=1 Tax=Asticcacaulis excentricus (strain ATCC 15261 / DSM 4724 / KCTC 12464 / NCIMB 9791 / VKM B-1370 / CB 48) TaxID=573065 RepID=E8RTM8_ASTEC|nr:TonB-dependent receptor [Asticcacaulis excentricus]ADU14849.1 TonB-dependent receptor [Asticcacaulis excentricus CB 48]